MDLILDNACESSKNVFNPINTGPFGGSSVPGGGGGADSVPPT